MLACIEAEHLLVSTDALLPDTLRALEQLDITPAQCHAVMQGNAERLLKP